jgi:hypothetical protein
MRVMFDHLVSCGIKLVLHASIARFKVYHSSKLTGINTSITYNFISFVRINYILVR